MGREIRKVPKDWEHPKEYKGFEIGERLKPLHEGNNGAYKNDADEWLENCIKWSQGKHKDQPKQYKYYWEWSNPPPSPDDYMPDFGESATHLMLYETTTEGSPCSPAFETLDELCEYAAEHCTTFADYKATKEEWEKMLEAGFVSHREGNNIFC